MQKRWSEEDIWKWYDGRPWITGVNFFPSVAINLIQLWQEYEHEYMFTETGKELALAASLGYNSVRMPFPFELWRVQPDVFFRHAEELLALCEKFGITVMPILFDDCCVAKELYRPIQLGKQPEPVPGYFGGSPASSFAVTSKVGYNVIDEPGMDEVVERYIREMAQHFGDDSRVLIWNVWNEAGNSNRGSLSLPMMRKVFGWLREYHVKQPLTADVFASMPGRPYPDEYLKSPRIETEIEQEAIALSDLISFHYYGDYLHTRGLMESLTQYGRPVIIDEWLHRPLRSFVQTHLPLFRKNRVGSYMFGFVNGKTQFNVVWDSLKNCGDLDTSLWMHDIFHSNFVPYDQEEIDTIRRCNLT